VRQRPASDEVFSVPGPQPPASAPDEPSSREEKVVFIPIGKGFHFEPFLIASSSARVVRDPQILIKASH